MVQLLPAIIPKIHEPLSHEEREDLIEINGYLHTGACSKNS